ncbi:MAG: signal peptidase I [Candidatus Woesearchaeota archaeon]
MTKSFRYFKRQYKRFIKFLNEDSFLSWVVNVALAFVLIRFIVYPLLGLVLATPFPIVAVVSGSMEHPGGFDEWWESPAVVDGNRMTQADFYAQYSIQEDDFGGFPFRNGFNTGDIKVLRGVSPEDVEIGDIIVFGSTERNPIIHRVIEKNINGSSTTFKTKGDNNPVSYEFESEIKEEDIIGKSIFRIPFLGYVKIWFFNLIGLFI